ncbi:hypothetical protein HK096_005995, partial [Nowakowskiella sp. JEL0078]
MVNHFCIQIIVERDNRLNSDDLRNKINGNLQIQINGPSQMNGDLRNQIDLRSKIKNNSRSQNEINLGGIKNDLRSQISSYRNSRRRKEIIKSQNNKQLQKQLNQPKVFDEQKVESNINLLNTWKPENRRKTDKLDDEEINFVISIVNEFAKPPPQLAYSKQSSYSKLKHPQPLNKQPPYSQQPSNSQQPNYPRQSTYVEQPILNHYQDDADFDEQSHEKVSMLDDFYHDRLIESPVNEFKEHPEQDQISENDDDYGNENYFDDEEEVGLEHRSWSPSPPPEKYPTPYETMSISFTSKFAQLHKLPSPKNPSRFF